MAAIRSGDTPKWTVTGVSPRIDVSNGAPVKGHTVSVLTANGQRTEVFVPDGKTLDQARDMVAAAVSYVDGLGALS